MIRHLFRCNLALSRPRPYRQAFHELCRLFGNRKVEEDSECSDEADREVVRVSFLEFSWRFRSALLDISYLLAGVTWLQWTRMRFMRSLRLRRVSMLGGSRSGR